MLLYLGQNIIITKQQLPKNISEHTGICKLTSLLNIPYGKICLKEVHTQTNKNGI